MQLTRASHTKTRTFWGSIEKCHWYECWVYSFVSL